MTLPTTRLTADLLHEAYGTSTVVTFSVLAEAVFFYAYNNHIIADVFAEHIRQNVEAYAFNLSKDGVVMVRSDEQDFFNALLDTIRTYTEWNEDDPELIHTTNEFKDIICNKLMKE